MESDEINSRVRGAVGGELTPAFKLWCDATSIYPADSPPALGCLLHLVREAWGKVVVTRPDTASGLWRAATCKWDRCDLYDRSFFSVTEAGALVLALEGADPLAELNK